MNATARELLRLWWRAFRFKALLVLCAFCFYGAQEWGWTVWGNHP